MPLPRIYFSRQDLVIVTGAPDAMLSYWIKGEILRPIEAGGGRGRHLRFSRLEAALGCFLYRLHLQGVATVALTDLAEAFHRSIEWIESKTRDPTNFEEIDKLVRARSKFISNDNPKGWDQYLEQTKSDQEWFDLSPSEVRFVQAVDPDEWFFHAGFYGCLVQLGLNRPTDKTHWVRLRRSEDEWSIVTKASKLDHISIELTNAAEQLWTLDK